MFKSIVSTKGSCGLMLAFLSALSVHVYAQATNEWRDAEHLYSSTCKYCHELGVGPVLKGRGAGLPVEYIKFRVRRGYNAMPAFKPSEISDKDIEMLGKWLSESKAGKPILKGAQYRARPEEND